MAGVRTSLLGAATWLAATLAATAAALAAASVARTAVVPSPRLGGPSPTPSASAPVAQPSSAGLSVLVTSPSSPMAERPAPTARAAPSPSPARGPSSATVVPVRSPPPKSPSPITVAGSGGVAAVECDAGGPRLIYAVPVSDFRLDAAHTTAGQVVFRDRGWITVISTFCDGDRAFGNAVEIPATVTQTTQTTRSTQTTRTAQSAATTPTAPARAQGLPVPGPAPHLSRPARHGPGRTGPRKPR